MAANHALSLYFLAKFVLYCALCAVLAGCFRLQLDSRFRFSVTWGAARFGLGVLFGLPIALVYFWLLGRDTPLAVSYIIAFGPIRVIEWALLFALIARRHPIRWGSRASAWILGGAAASMLSDGVAILAGADKIKVFC